MKKIIAIAGSNNQNSQTCRLLNLWLARMAQLDSTVEYEVLLLRDFYIALCEGCRTCFQQGPVPWTGRTTCPGCGRSCGRAM